MNKKRKKKLVLIETEHNKKVKNDDINTILYRRSIRNIFHTISNHWKIEQKT